MGQLVDGRILQYLKSIVDLIVAGTMITYAELQTWSKESSCASVLCQLGCPVRWKAVIVAVPDCERFTT